MIAIDTNVLLRHVLQDDKTQSPKAKKLFEGESWILITDVVLAEAVWTLTGKKYRATRDDIVMFINGLLSEPNIAFESAQVVWRALNYFRRAKPVKVSGKTRMVDFADALITHKSNAIAEEYGEELEAFYTFDVSALSLKGAASP